MRVSEAVKIWLSYQKSHFKENSIRAYHVVLSRFREEFAEEELEGIATDRILSFLNRITAGKKHQTKRTRYSHLSAFFNFIKNNINQHLRNPRDRPMLKKIFRAKPPLS